MFLRLFTVSPSEKYTSALKILQFRFPHQTPLELTFIVSGTISMRSPLVRAHHRPPSPCAGTINSLIPRKKSPPIKVMPMTKPSEKEYHSWRSNHKIKFVSLIMDMCIVYISGVSRIPPSSCCFQVQLHNIDVFLMEQVVEMVVSSCGLWI